MCNRVIYLENLENHENLVFPLNGSGVLTRSDSECRSATLSLREWVTLLCNWRYESTLQMHLFYT
jgi:hypothetical protein